MLWVLLFTFLFFAFLTYASIRVGDERRFLDEHFVALRVYTYYGQEKHKIIAEWPPEGAARCVTLHVYVPYVARRDDNPHLEFFPQVVLRTYKTTGEVYDWYEIY